MVLPLLESDLFTILEACAKGTLDQVDVKFSDKHACCVILASDGYPSHYETGFPITLPKEPEHGYIYIAGAARKDGQLVTGGGRVLGAVAVADTLPEAIDQAYALAIPSSLTTPIAAGTSASAPSRQGRSSKWYIASMWKKSPALPTRRRRF